MALCGENCLITFSNATRNRMMPPDNARMGIGMPYRFKMLSPNTAASNKARLEKRVALMASLRANAGGAFFVMDANGPITLKGPSIKKRNVNICILTGTA